MLGFHDFALFKGWVCILYNSNGVPKQLQFGAGACLWSVTQARPLEPAKGSTWRPPSCSWGASPTGVLLAHTPQGRSLYTERNYSPGKLGMQLHRRGRREVVVVGLDLCRSYVCFPSTVGALSTLCTLRSMKWGVLSPGQSVYELGEHLGQKLSSIRLRVASLVRMEAGGGSAPCLQERGRCVELPEFIPRAAQVPLPASPRDWPTPGVLSQAGVLHLKFAIMFNFLNVVCVFSLTVGKQTAY